MHRLNAVAVASLDLALRPRRRPLARAPATRARGSRRTRPGRCRSTVSIATSQRSRAMPSGRSLEGSVAVTAPRPRRCSATARRVRPAIGEPLISTRTAAIWSLSIGRRRSRSAPASSVNSTSSSAVGSSAMIVRPSARSVACALPPLAIELRAWSPGSARRQSAADRDDPGDEVAHRDSESDHWASRPLSALTQFTVTMPVCSLAPAEPLARAYAACEAWRGRTTRIFRSRRGCCRRRCGRMSRPSTRSRGWPTTSPTKGRRRRPSVKRSFAPGRDRLHDAAAADVATRSASRRRATI